MSRVLREQTDRYRFYDVLDDSGEIVGEDVEPILTAADVNEAAIYTQARAAVGGNLAYLAAPTATAAQTARQVRELTRQVNGLLRLLTRQLDGAD